MTMLSDPPVEVHVSWLACEGWLGGGWAPLPPAGPWEVARPLVY